jgi:hypothetical protein
MVAKVTRVAKGAWLLAEYTFHKDHEVAGYKMFSSQDAIRCE